MKNKEFKQLAQHAGTLLKKYIFFRDNHEKYLKNKSITLEEIEQLKQELNLELTDVSQQEDIEDNNILLRLLRVKSFYCNYNLFKALKGNKKDYTLYSEFKKVLYSKTYNERVDLIDIEELKKNIDIQDDSWYQLVILEKALTSCNEELYKFSEPYLNWKRDKDNILHLMGKCITHNGKKIKDTPLGEHIKKHINLDNLREIKINLEKPSYEENVNSFFNIDIIDLVTKDLESKEEFNYYELRNLNLSNNQVKHILKNLKKEKNNINYENRSDLIFYYLSKEDKNVSFINKFSFLENLGLLTNELWKAILRPYNIVMLKVFFDNNHHLQNRVSVDRLNNIMTTYTEQFLETVKDVEDVKDFFEKYPGKLSKEDFINTLNKVIPVKFTTSLEQQAIELVREKYLFQLDMKYPDENDLELLVKQEHEWIDFLYEKYPQYMKNEQIMLDIVSSSNNDLFLSCYLTKFFENNDNKALKSTIVKNLGIFNSYYSFKKTLEWVIDNNLLNDIMNKENPKNLIFIDKSSNYLVPLLIEKYGISKEFVLEQTIKTKNINNQLFMFMLKNYEVVSKDFSLESKNKICQQIYIYNYESLAQELLKKNIYPDEISAEVMRDFPNKAGNVLLKGRLKENLETNFAETKKHKEKIKKI